MDKDSFGENEYQLLGYKDAFEIMMKSTKDSIFFKDRESRFTYISSTQLKRMNKTELKDVIGKTDFDFFTLEHATKSFQAEQQIIQTGIPIVDEEEHSKFANGELSWSKVSRYPLYDSQGEIIGTWGISTDITSQKEAEFQIKEKEARYHLLADITIEGIVIHEGGIIKDANPSIAKMFGYEQSEILGRNIIDFIREDDRVAVAEKLANNSDRLLEINLIKKDGTAFLAEVEGNSMGVPGSRLRMAAVRDITRRKQTENALVDREIQILSITDSAYDAILMMDPNGNITYWNLAAERVFGYKSEEAIGKNLHQLIAPAYYHAAHLAAFPNFIKSGEGNAIGKTLNLNAMRKDKTTVSVQLSLSAAKLSSGWHAIGILRDVTEQRKNEEELIKAKTVAEEATNAKSEFLANMSHEIRTPMNAVIGFSDLLKRTDMTAKQRDYINKIESSAKSLLGIINDILDFSKIEAGKLELETVSFRLDDVVNNIISMNSNKAAEKNIELINNIANDVPNLLLGDPLRVGQILLNLVNNAVKFTDKGSVLVETKLVKQSGQRCQIEFSVSDTGIGLTTEQKSKLFSAFSQADTSVTRRFGGTGLGLTISKRLVEMMKGEIRVESEFGVGSTFSFIIDFAIQEEDTRKKIINRKRLQNLRVLIVDDNEVSREILKEQIDSFGIDAVAVASGQEAIDEVKKKSSNKPYDLVIMDWRMPEMDGIEAAGTILKDKSIKHLPMAMMVSAFGREEVARKAEKIGINTFLMKPINQSLLFETIVNMFEMDKNDITIHNTQGENTNAASDRLDGIRILLVEDNGINQEVASEILNSVGAIVEIANNGKESIEAIANKAYDLVLMDLQMPVMGGYEATKLIRADAKNKDLPIIAMTAHAMHGVEAECIAAGMNGYVSKPIDPDNLFTTIRIWAKPKNTEETLQRSKEQEATDQQTAEPDLPARVDGIDLKAGVGRVNGNTKLFKKLLLNFGNSSFSYVAEIRKYVGEGDFDHAQHVAHTLKGVAGNISATKIHGIVTRLEPVLVAGASDQYKRVLAELDAATSELRKTLKSLKHDAQTEPEAMPEDWDLQEIETIVRELARFIWQDDIDAQKTLDQLKRKSGSRYIETISQIARCIEEFDFDAAKKPLVQLAAELNIKLDGEKDE